MASSALAVIELFPGSALGQTEKRASEAGKPAGRLPKQMQERMEKSKAFSDRMRNAHSMDERVKIMEEHRAWEGQRAVEDLKDQLGISDREWPVLKPRIETVYNLVHPALRMRPGSAQSRTEVERRSRELRELLQDEKVPVEQIKARLTALRAARQRVVEQLMNARQGLRQLLTLRQEAVLVLNGLLD